MSYKPKKPVRNKIAKCFYCRRVVTGVCISTKGAEVSHPACYDKNHKPKMAGNVADVIGHTYNPDLSKRLCLTFIGKLPSNVQAEMVEMFNKRLMQNWLDRCGFEDKA